MQMFRATLKPMRLRQVHRDAHKCRRISSSSFSSCSSSSFLFRVSRGERSTATRVGGAYPSRKLLPLLFKQGQRGSSVSFAGRTLRCLVLVDSRREDAGMNVCSRGIHPGSVLSNVSNHLFGHPASTSFFFARS